MLITKLELAIRKKISNIIENTFFAKSRFYKYKSKKIKIVFTLKLGLKSFKVKKELVKFVALWRSREVPTYFGTSSTRKKIINTGVRIGLSKEIFIAAVVVSTFVDFTRLAVYCNTIHYCRPHENLAVVICATFAGTFIGNKLLKKVTSIFIQTLVAIMLIIISLRLGSGLL